jgi:hypothetical protein
MSCIPVLRKRGSDSFNRSQAGGTFSFILAPLNARAFAASLRAITYELVVNTRSASADQLRVAA